MCYIAFITYMLYNISMKGVQMFNIQYYTKNNSCPIHDFLTTIPKKDLSKILREIDLLQEFGFQLGMPHVKKMKGTEDIWELRIKIASNNYRVFYFTLKAETYLMLHAFQKKSTKTPTKELRKAINYKNEFLGRSVK